MKKHTLFLLTILLVATSYSTQAWPLQNTLSQAKDKVYGIIDGALEKARKVIAEAEAAILGFGEKLKEKVDEFVDKVKEDVANFLEKLDGKIDEIIGDVNNPNLSKCKKLGHIVRQTVLETAANVSHCAIEKLKTGEKYIDNIREISEEVLSQLKELRGEADDCVANVSGIKATTEAIFCINKVGTRAAWIAAKRIPEISANAAKLGLLVSTLHISLPYCASTNGLNTLFENSDYLLGGVKNCVKEVIQGDSTPEISEVPEHTEVPGYTEQSKESHLPEHTEYPEVPEYTEEHHTQQPEISEKHNFPESSEHTEQLESLENVEEPKKPEFPENIEQPEFPENIEQPKKPEFLENIEQPKKPEFPENIEQPEFSENIEQPKKPEFPKLPDLEHDNVDFSEETH